jgi:hypothetical protein
MMTLMSSMSEETYSVMRHDLRTGAKSCVGEHLTIRQAEIYCDVADELDGAGGSGEATYAPQLETKED